MEAGPGAGRRRAGLRGALHGEEDQEVRRCGEEGGQEKWGSSRKHVERRLGR